MVVKRVKRVFGKVYFVDVARLVRALGRISGLFRHILCVLPPSDLSHSPRSKGWQCICSTHSFGRV